MLPLRCALLLLLGVLAAGPGAVAAESGHLYLEVSPTNGNDLANLFDALEDSAEELNAEDPVVVVLHGEEAGYFTRQNYSAHKALVDRAALLDAKRLIDVRMCETWMLNHNVDASDLPAFIETVPFAPEEIDRLKSEGYLPYPAVQI